MSGFSTRWVILQQHRVEPADLDADGVVGDDAIERWITAACVAYLDRCATLQEIRERRRLSLRLRIMEPRAGARLAGAETVVVSAGATELRPADFTIAVRLRTTADSPVNAACEISLEAPGTGEACELGDEIRDEVIALEHAAAHFN